MKVHPKLLVCLFVITLCVSMLVSVVSLAAPTSLDRIEVSGDAIQVGDLVVKGMRHRDNTCTLPDFRVGTSSSSNESTEWVAMQITEQCEIVVTARWEGSLTEGPAQVIDSLLALMPGLLEPISEKNQSEVTSHMGALATASGTKTSEQHIYMWGGDGPPDQLTHKYGKLKFSYNGTSAWINSQSGSCNGSTPASWSWVVDSCTTVHVQSGPASTVSRVGNGSYHCSPAGGFPCNLSNPDGFYHTLLDEEDGYANGSSTCYFSFSGIIVIGVSQQILQGCS